MKEMARKIALQLSAMNPTLEKDTLEKAIGSMPVLVLHSNHNHRDESLEKDDELVREHQHISEDLEDADELDDETKHIEKYPEYPDESIPERQLPDHKHISEDLENGDELDAETVIHEHIEDDLENPEGLIEQEQEHEIISEDPVIERKNFHKHIDGDMEDVSELVSEEEHEHISEDLENGEEIIAEKLNNHVHKEIDVDEIGRKAGKKLKRPTVDDVILEKSGVTLYGTELISTPTTITLHFQVLRDNGQTPPQGYQLCVVRLKNNVTLASPTMSFEKDQYEVYEKKTMEKYGIPVIMAEFERSYLPQRVVIGNGNVYGGFRNGPLDPGSFYQIFFRELHGIKQTVNILKITEYAQNIENVGSPSVYSTLKGKHPVKWVKPVLASLILLGGFMGLVAFQIVRNRKKKRKKKSKRKSKFEDVFDSESQSVLFSSYSSDSFNPDTDKLFIRHASNASDLENGIIMEPIELLKTESMPQLDINNAFKVSRQPSSISIGNIDDIDNYGLNADINKWKRQIRRGRGKGIPLSEDGNLQVEAAAVGEHSINADIKELEAMDAILGCTSENNERSLGTGRSNMSLDTFDNIDGYGLNSDINKQKMKITQGRGRKHTMPEEYNLVTKDPHTNNDRSDCSLSAIVSSNSSKYEQDIKIPIHRSDERGKELRTSEDDHLEAVTAQVSEHSIQTDMEELERMDAMLDYLSQKSEKSMTALKSDDSIMDSKQVLGSVSVSSFGSLQDTNEKYNADESKRLDMGTQKKRQSEKRRDKEHRTSEDDHLEAETAKVSEHSIQTDMDELEQMDAMLDYLSEESGKSKGTPNALSFGNIDDINKYGLNTDTEKGKRQIRKGRGKELRTSEEDHSEAETAQNSKHSIQDDMEELERMDAMLDYLSEKSDKNKGTPNTPEIKISPHPNDINKYTSLDIDTDNGKRQMKKGITKEIPISEDSHSEIVAAKISEHSIHADIEELEKMGEILDCKSEGSLEIALNNMDLENKFQEIRLNSDINKQKRKMSMGRGRKQRESGGTTQETKSPKTRNERSYGSTEAHVKDKNAVVKPLNKSELSSSLTEKSENDSTTERNKRGLSAYDATEKSKKMNSLLIGKEIKVASPKRQEMKSDVVKQKVSTEENTSVAEALDTTYDINRSLEATVLSNSPQYEPDIKIPIHPSDGRGKELRTSEDDHLEAEIAKVSEHSIQTDMEELEQMDAMFDYLSQKSEKSMTALKSDDSIVGSKELLGSVSVLSFDIPEYRCSKFDNQVREVKSKELRTSEDNHLEAETAKVSEHSIQTDMEELEQMDAMLDYLSQKSEKSMTALKSNDSIVGSKELLGSVSVLSFDIPENRCSKFDNQVRKGRGKELRISEDNHLEAETAKVSEHAMLDYLSEKSEKSMTALKSDDSIVDPKQVLGSVSVLSFDIPENRCSKFDKPVRKGKSKELRTSEDDHLEAETAKVSEHSIQTDMEELERMDAMLDYLSQKSEKSMTALKSDDSIVGSKEVLGSISVLSFGSLQDSNVKYSADEPKRSDKGTIRKRRSEKGRDKKCPISGIVGIEAVPSEVSEHIIQTDILEELESMGTMLDCLREKSEKILGTDRSQKSIENIGEVDHCGPNPVISNRKRKTRKRRGRNHLATEEYAQEVVAPKSRNDTSERSSEASSSPRSSQYGGFRLNKPDFRTSANSAKNEYSCSGVISETNLIGLATMSSTKTSEPSEISPQQDHDESFEEQRYQSSILSSNSELLLLSGSVSLLSMSATVDNDLKEDFPTDSRRGDQILMTGDEIADEKQGGLVQLSLTDTAKETNKFISWLKPVSSETGVMSVPEVVVINDSDEKVIKTPQLTSMHSDHNRVETVDSVSYANNSTEAQPKLEEDAKVIEVSPSMLGFDNFEADQIVKNVQGETEMRFDKDESDRGLEIDISALSFSDEMSDRASEDKRVFKTLVDSQSSNKSTGLVKSQTDFTDPAEPDNGDIGSNVSDRTLSSSDWCSYSSSQESVETPGRNKRSSFETDLLDAKKALSKARKRKMNKKAHANHKIPGRRCRYPPSISEPCKVQSSKTPRALETTQKSAEETEQTWNKNTDNKLFEAKYERHEAGIEVDVSNISFTTKTDESVYAESSAIDGTNTSITGSASSATYLMAHIQNSGLEFATISITEDNDSRGELPTNFPEDDITLVADSGSSIRNDSVELVDKESIRTDLEELKAIESMLELMSEISLNKSETGQSDVSSKTTEGIDKQGEIESSEELEIYPSELSFESSRETDEKESSHESNCSYDKLADVEPIPGESEVLPSISSTPPMNSMNSDLKRVGSVSFDDNSTGAQPGIEDAKVTKVTSGTHSFEVNQDIYSTDVGMVGSTSSGSDLMSQVSDNAWDGGIVDVPSKYALPSTYSLTYCKNENDILYSADMVESENSIENIDEERRDSELDLLNQYKQTNSMLASKKTEAWDDDIMDVPSKYSLPRTYSLMYYKNEDQIPGEDVGESSSSSESVQSIHEDTLKNEVRAIVRSGTELDILDQDKQTNSMLASKKTEAWDDDIMDVPSKYSLPRTYSLIYCQNEDQIHGEDLGESSLSSESVQSIHEDALKNEVRAIVTASNEADHKSGNCNYNQEKGVVKNVCKDSDTSMLASNKTGSTPLKWSSRLRTGGVEKGEEARYEEPEEGVEVDMNSPIEVCDGLSNDSPDNHMWVEQFDQKIECSPVKLLVASGTGSPTEFLSSSAVTLIGKSIQDMRNEPESQLSERPVRNRSICVGTESQDTADHCNQAETDHRNISTQVSNSRLVDSSCQWTTEAKEPIERTYSTAGRDINPYLDMMGLRKHMADNAENEPVIREIDNNPPIIKKSYMNVRNNISGVFRKNANSNGIAGKEHIQFEAGELVSAPSCSGTVSSCQIIITSADSEKTLDDTCIAQKSKEDENGISEKRGVSDINCSSDYKFPEPPSSINLVETDDAYRSDYMSSEQQRDSDEFSGCSPESDPSSNRIVNWRSYASDTDEVKMGIEMSMSAISFGSSQSGKHVSGSTAPDSKRTNKLRYHPFENEKTMEDVELNISNFSFESISADPSCVSVNREVGDQDEKAVRFENVQNLDSEIYETERIEKQTVCDIISTLEVGVIDKPLIQEVDYNPPIISVSYKDVLNKIRNASEISDLCNQAEPDHCHISTQVSNSRMVDSSCQWTTDTEEPIERTYSTAGRDNNPNPDIMGGGKHMAENAENESVIREIDNNPPIIKRSYKYVRNKISGVFRIEADSGQEHVQCEVGELVLAPSRSGQINITSADSEQQEEDTCVTQTSKEIENGTSEERGMCERPSSWNLVETDTSSVRRRDSDDRNNCFSGIDSVTENFDLEEHEKGTFSGCSPESDPSSNRNFGWRSCASETDELRMGIEMSMSAISFGSSQSGKHVSGSTAPDSKRTNKLRYHPFKNEKTMKDVELDISNFSFESISVDPSCVSVKKEVVDQDEETSAITQTPNLDSDIYENERILKQTAIRKVDYNHPIISESYKDVLNKIRGASEISDHRNQAEPDHNCHNMSTQVCDSRMVDSSCQWTTDTEEPIERTYSTAGRDNNLYLDIVGLKKRMANNSDYDREMNNNPPIIKKSYKDIRNNNSGVFRKITDSTGITGQEMLEEKIDKIRSKVSINERCQSNSKIH
ncbi:uncharacterized protein LOC134826282 [Bolinopsis microptera]|uniref:uncharacterized protein LOC134826282 n=1 Tax=Bolinopsis microptera TaxID=2820187 RepID=UPI00307A4D59